ncbi:MAG: hypothetical protein AAGC95_12110 [Pseudomonadota bacterium]
MRLTVVALFLIVACVGGLYVYAEQLSAPSAPVSYELQNDFPR